MTDTVTPTLTNAPQSPDGWGRQFAKAAGTGAFIIGGTSIAMGALAIASAGTFGLIAGGGAAAAAFAAATAIIAVPNAIVSAVSLTVGLFTRRLAGGKTDLSVMKPAPKYLGLAFGAVASMVVPAIGLLTVAEEAVQPGPQSTTLTHMTATAPAQNAPSLQLKK